MKRNENPVAIFSRQDFVFKNRLILPYTRNTGTRNASVFSLETEQGVFHALDKFSHLRNSLTAEHFDPAHEG